MHGLRLRKHRHRADRRRQRLDSIEQSAACRPSSRAGLTRGSSADGPTRTSLTTWNARGPFGDALNPAQKDVASSSAGTSLNWPNSTLLHGDVPAAVAELEEHADTNLVMCLGAGRRMFSDGVHATFRLTECETTSKGVIVATYERAEYQARHRTNGDGRIEGIRWCSPEAAARRRVTR
jgi:hypothetical protein